MSPGSIEIDLKLASAEGLLLSWFLPVEARARAQPRMEEYEAKVAIVQAISHKLIEDDQCVKKGRCRKFKKLGYSFVTIYQKKSFYYSFNIAVKFSQC
jgi:hypothetical protein